VASAAYRKLTTAVRAPSKPTTKLGLARESTNMPNHSSRLLLVVVVSIALIGCGGRSDSAAVQGVVRDYVNASLSGDGNEACRDLSGAALRGLTGPAFGNSTCQQAIVSLSRGFAKGQAQAAAAVPIHVQVHGDTAVATFKPKGQETDTYGLTKANGVWQITSLMAGGTGRSSND
jgi:hypothetical protein